MPNVEIPEEVLRRLSDLKRAGDPRKISFEPWQDEILLQYWKHRDYRQEGVAEILGYAIGTCRRRYEELMSAKPSDKREPTTGVDSRDSEGMFSGRDKAAPIDRTGDSEGAA